MNGIGERAGNAALEEIVMALRTRSEYFGGLDTGVRAEELAKHQPPGRPAHRLPGPVQQGRRGPQRLRPRGGHPPARGAGGAHAPTRSWTPRPWARAAADRAGQALGPPRLRRHAGEDGPHRPGRRPEPGLRPVQGAGRPQGRAHRRRPRGDRGRGARTSSATDAFELSSIEFRGGNVGPATATVVLVRPPTARRWRPRPRATA